MSGRIRSIKPEALKDEELWDLEQETGLPVFRAFVGLWMQADRRGRFEWRPRKLHSEVLPYWDGDFSRVLDVLVTRGFLVRYACRDRFFGWIPTFERHQFINGKEPESRLPAPPQTAIDSDTSHVTHASGTGEERVPHASIPSLPDPIPDPVGVQGEGGEGPVSPPERPRDPFGDSLRGRRAQDDPGVIAIFEAWKLAHGFNGSKFRQPADHRADLLLEAVKTHGVEPCLRVLEASKTDPMVTGKADDKGQHHRSIEYIFKPSTFDRLLRDADEAAHKKTKSVAELTRQARML